jgi:hypothetical protein
VIKRREFITLFGGAAAWPLAASAEQRTPVIGFLSSRSAQDSVHLVDGWRRGLNDVGLVEGHDFPEVREVSETPEFRPPLPVSGSAG